MKQIYKTEIRKEGLNNNCGTCGMDFKFIPATEKLGIHNNVAYCPRCACDIARSLKDDQ